ncbi:hypothetical protein CVT26_004747 [Gymnopilus dilepis]|uniref:CipC protein n=1 Tax=Gymnopilus dilepis TaxID=231916 RepID=A0A409XZH2_9AGAR|nr:hypothetical protein CVT26_004747 [Gymnopilus dilepis]
MSLSSYHPVSPAFLEESGNLPCGVVDEEHTSARPLGWLQDLSDKEAAWEQVNSAGHKADLSHELLAAAASYEAVKKYEEHVANNGVPDSHAKAKEFLAAAAGGFIDRIVETKGLDYIDKKKAEHAAKNQTYEVVTEESYNQV